MDNNHRININGICIDVNSRNSEDDKKNNFGTEYPSDKTFSNRGINIQGGKVGIISTGDNVVINSSGNFKDSSEGYVKVICVGDTANNIYVIDNKGKSKNVCIYVPLNSRLVSDPKDSEYTITINSENILDPALDVTLDYNSAFNSGEISYKSSPKELKLERFKFPLETDTYRIYSIYFRTTDVIVRMESKGKIISNIFGAKLIAIPKSSLLENKNVVNSIISDASELYLGGINSFKELFFALLGKTSKGERVVWALYPEESALANSLQIHLQNNKEGC